MAVIFPPPGKPLIERTDFELYKDAASLLRRIRNNLYEFDFDCQYIDQEVWDSVDAVLEEIGRRV